MTTRKFQLLKGQRDKKFLHKALSIHEVTNCPVRVKHMLLEQ